MVLIYFLYISNSHTYVFDKTLDINESVKVSSALSSSSSSPVLSSYSFLRFFCFCYFDMVSGQCNGSLILMNFLLIIVLLCWIYPWLQHGDPWIYFLRKFNQHASWVHCSALQKLQIYQATGWILQIWRFSWSSVSSSLGYLEQPLFPRSNSWLIVIIMEFGVEPW